MKLCEIALPKSLDDENDEHITAATYMRVLRRVFTEAKFSSGAQPRNTKTAKVVSITAEVPAANSADAQKAFAACESEVRQMKGVTNFKVTPSPYKGPNGGNLYAIAITTMIMGVQKERMDFIKDVQTRVKAMQPQWIDCSAENRKDGAYVTIGQNIHALITQSNPAAQQAGRDATNDQMEELIDDLIQQYGDRLQVDVEDYYTKVSYH